MYRAILFIVIVILLAVPLRAQSTLVSGTVVDADSIAWASGTYTFTSAAYPTVPIITGTLDANGAFTNITFPLNNATSSVGSRWTAKICSITIAPCFNTSVIVAVGPSMSLTSSLSPPAIRLSASSQPPITAYSDVEITGAVQGSRYFNVTDSTEHVCKAIPCSSNWQSTPSNTSVAGCQHVNSSQTFAQALAVSGVTCIQVDPGTFPVNTNTTVPATVGLSFSKGGLLSISNAVTLTVNSPIYASPDSQIFTYVGTGVAVLGGANAVISNAWFPGADWCAQTNASLLSLQAGSNRGGTVDARHYLTAQTCAANPFAGVTMPFQLLIPNANIALNDERAQWLQTSSAEFIYGGNPNLNPGQIYPTSWPEGTLSGTVGVVVTTNVAAVTLTSALPRAPVVGSVWCIAGTSDPIVEGCVQVLASPAPTTTTFSYNAPTVSNRTVTGGIAGPAMIAFSGNTVQSSSYRNIYVSGNGLADFIFANITGQEQSGFYDSTLVQYCTNAIFSGGLNQSLGAGPGNTGYTNNIITTSTSCAHSYTKDVWFNRQNVTRQALRDTTINGNGGSVASGDGVLLYDAAMNFQGLHIENRTNAIHLIGGPGYSILTGNQLTCTAAVPCTTAINSDNTGGQITVSHINTTGTNLILNFKTNTTLTGTLLAYYTSTVNGAEDYLLDNTNLLAQTNGLGFIEETPRTPATGTDICYGDSTLHNIRCAMNNGVFQNFPQIIALTSQYTNSTTTFTNVAGGNTIQFPVLANTNYTATCHLYYQAAATGGLNIEFTGPASPTAVRYGMDLPTALTAVASGEADAFGSSIGAVSTNGAANLDAMISFSLINGANAGTVNLLAKSSAAVQLQIQSGSYCQIQ